MSATAQLGQASWTLRNSSGDATWRRAIVVSLLVVAASASCLAQTVADSIPPFARPNGALLRTGSLTYSLTLTKATGEVTALGRRVVTVTDAPTGGTPAWLIAESRLGTAVETADSVFLARTDLAPIRWTSAIGRASLGASFTRDSMFGGVGTYQGRAPFGAPLPLNALLSAGMLERIIEMLPLAGGYRSSATLVLIEGLSPRAVSAEIRVEGDDRVQVGSRVVDCQRVVLRAGNLEERLWVSRDDARVVRIDQRTNEGMLTSILEQR